MKFFAALLVACATGSCSSAFQPMVSSRRFTTAVHLKGADMSGNSWKPDSDKMGSTDTGDYFPEGYDPNEVAFTEGWQGSQKTGDNRREGPALPGMENLGADAVMMGGIVQATDIPEGMEFIPSSVPDGELKMNVQAAAGSVMEVSVKPVCMGFEDYYAGFSAQSHPSFSVSPAVGRMDRRGGKPTLLQVSCDPHGITGPLEADLIVNLPEDNSKICYKIKAVSF